MSSVHLDRVSFSYTSAVSIISDASFDLGPGWVGLVGANGSGKSTLLHLISRQLEPDSGSVWVTPTDTAPVLCEQRVDEPTDEIESFGRDWETTSARIRSRLGLDPVALHGWESLSPGERKRWQVGAALAQEPDVLLLDEPTNHLDSEARSLLVEVLGRYRGCGIIVSHDRALLNQLTDKTIRVQCGGVEIWGGPYDVAHREWEAAAEETQNRYDSLKREHRRTSRRLGDQRRKGEQKDAERMRVRRTAGKHDLDARGSAATGRHAMGQKAGAKERTSTRGRLGRLSETIDEMDIGKGRGGAVSFDFEPSPKEFIIRYEGLVVAGERRLFDVDVEVRRSDRVRVAGPNGVGKTSLLETLLARLSIPETRYLSLAQETTADDDAALLDAVRSLPDADKGRVLSLVSLLGADPGALLASGRPSPGEARKLGLALGLGTPKWLLMLDEPTNHLDLPSIERLEAALEGFRGALLMVTHDETLAERVTDITWNVEGSGVTTL